jgi:hypothetical protein
MGHASEMGMHSHRAFWLCPRKVTMLLGTLALVACGGGGVGGGSGGAGGGTGGAGGAPGEGAGYVANRAGQIALLEYDGGTGTSAWLASGPSPPPEERIAAAGDCALYAHREAATCSQPCDGFCQPPSTCVPFPAPVSAGPITVNGLRRPLVFQPSEFGYVPSDTAWPIDLFTDEAIVTASAPGAAGVPAFAVTARGVSPLAANLGTLVLEDSADEVVRWTAAPGAGATGAPRIQLALRVGWHGAPYQMMLLCESADDGELTIPRQLIAQLPPFGGVGLFPWPSNVTRFTRGVASTAAGPVELFVGSQANVSWSHESTGGGN